MTEIKIRRRSLLQAGAAASALTMVPGLAQAQPKIAPPNIIKAGTLVMSINPTLPPLQYVDDKGELKGMRVELANECCKKLGLAPEYIRTEFATMIPGLAAKRWDMINTGIFWTEERSKLMYMIPYEQAAISFLAAKGNPLGLKTVDDLAGKRIAVELGGIEERRTREVAKMATDKGLKPINVMTFNNFAEAFQALRAGQADAATSIDATAMFMQNRGDFTRAISGVFPQIACFALANKTAADAIVGALNDLKIDRVVDVDRPAVLARRLARHAQVAAEVHQDARGALGHQLLGDEVGREALAESARVQPRASVHAHRARLGVDDERVSAPVGCGRSRRRLVMGLAGQEREVAVVAGGHERVQQRRVEASAGHPLAVQRPLGQQQRVAGDRDRRTRGAIDARHLAVGDEPAPALLELANAGERVRHVVRLALGQQDVDLRPHGGEAQLDRHRRDSARAGTGGRIVATRVAAARRRLRLGADPVARRARAGTGADLEPRLASAGGAGLHVGVVAALLRGQARARAAVGAPAAAVRAGLDDLPAVRLELGRVRGHHALRRGAGRIAAPGGAARFAGVDLLRAGRRAACSPAGRRPRPPRWWSAPRRWSARPWWSAAARSWRRAP